MNDKTRQQLREHLTAQANAQMTVNTLLLKALEIAKAVVKDYEGKVINKRIAAKIQDAVRTQVHDKLSVDLEASRKADYSYIEIGCYEPKLTGYQTSDGSWHYIDRKSTSFVICHSPLDKRMLSKETEKTIANIDSVANYQKEDNDKFQNALDNFDEYINMSEEICRLKEEYEKKCPYMLRRDIIIGSQIGSLGYW